MALTLSEAVDHIVGRSVTDAGRLGRLADYITERFAARGLSGVRGGQTGELAVKGFARTKVWDVAFDFAGKPRLLISLKSLWNNAGGSIPNRIDDLMGEAANVQQMSPEIVTGYVVLFDRRADGMRRDGMLWSDYFEQRVKVMSVRKAPLWNQGLIEGCWFVLIDSTHPPGLRIVDPLKAAREEDSFLSALLGELRRREPAIPLP